jgi:hypothetical protein
MELRIKRVALRNRMFEPADCFRSTGDRELGLGEVVAVGDDGVEGPEREDFRSPPP